MRVRALAFAFLLAGALSARAAAVRVMRFDAQFPSGEHSALCVVPGTVKDPAVAPYICYYVIPGNGKIRDNTRADRVPQAISDSDSSFVDWLRVRLSDDNECDLSAIAAGADFPIKEALEARCRGLRYQTGVVPAGTSETFTRDVHKAVDATLPQQAQAAPPPAVVPAPAPEVPATTLPAIDTAAPVEIATTKTDTSVVDGAPNTDTGGPSTETQGPPAPDGNELAFSFDWRTGLLIFIAVLVALLAAERVVSLVPRPPPPVTKAPAIDAAGAVQREREEAAQALEAAKRSFGDLQKTLAAVDHGLGLGTDEERAARIGSLVQYEQALLRLAGDASSTPAAITAIETRLKERKEIETLLGKGGDLVGTVRDQVALVHACSGPFWGHAKTADIATVAIQEVESGVHRLYRSIDQPGPSEPDAKYALKAIQQALDKLREQQKTIDSQQRTLSAVRSFITSQWRDVATDDLHVMVGTFAQRMREARARVASIGCDGDRNADAVITELAAVVESERKIAHGAHEILGHLGEYLALSGGDGESLRRIIVAERGTPNRILRLVLTAAVPLIRTTVDQLTAGEESRVIQLLRIPKILSELDAFLGRLSTYSSAELWQKGLQGGFSQNWLHYLFRAEAVLRTYFMTSSLAELGDSLTAIVWAFRHAIATASGYQVDRIQLLGELPASMDPAHGSTRDLQSFPDIRNRVQAVLKTQHEGVFAIDVDSVGLRNGTQVLRRGTLVVANRHEWEA